MATTIVILSSSLSRDLMEINFTVGELSAVEIMKSQITIIRGGRGRGVCVCGGGGGGGEDSTTPSAPMLHKVELSVLHLVMIKTQ